MTDKTKQNLTSGIMAMSGALLIGLFSHPGSNVESIGIIIGIVLLAFGGILRGSIKE